MSTESTVKCTKCQRPQDRTVTNDDLENLRKPGRYIKLSCQHDDCREDFVIGRCWKCKNKKVGPHAVAKCQFDKNHFYCPKCAINAPVERSNATGVIATLQQIDHVQEPPAEIKPSAQNPTDENQQSEPHFKTYGSASPLDSDTESQGSATLTRLSGIEHALEEIGQRLDALQNGQVRQSAIEEDEGIRLKKVSESLARIDERLIRLESVTKHDLRKLLDDVHESIQYKVARSLDQLLKNPVLDEKLVPQVRDSGIDVDETSPWYQIAQLIVDQLESSATMMAFNQLHPELQKMQSDNDEWHTEVLKRLIKIRCAILGKTDGEKPRFEWHSIPKGMKNEIQRFEDQLSKNLSDELKGLSAGGTFKSKAEKEAQSNTEQNSENRIPENLAAILCEAIAFYPQKEVFESGTAARLVEDLPALFNFLEDQRLYWTTRAEKAPEPDEHAPEVAGDYKATDQEVASVLNEFDQKFHSWQMANHIRRIPETDSPEFNHRYHFPVTTELTDDRDKHRLIKKVEHYGYVFNDGAHEIVLQKAGVVVWNCPDV
jgi:hypothetical protein